MMVRSEENDYRSPIHSFVHVECLSRQGLPAEQNSRHAAGAWTEAGMLLSSATRAFTHSQSRQLHWQAPAVPPRQQALLALISSEVNPSLNTIKDVVLQAAEDAISTQDWIQLQSAFSAAAAQRNASASGQCKDTRPRPSGGSPWGFALRQPGVTRGVAPKPPSSKLQGRSIAQPETTGGDPQLWEWAAVQQFSLLGLGSIAGLVTGAANNQAARPTRLGFRLMQLALAVALQQHLLPGLTSRPTAYDPDFGPSDIELLNGLGFEAASVEPDLSVSAPTLLYMPCCPRQLYSDILAANWAQLPQLAIFGTSMSSLSNSQSLFTALVGQSSGPTCSQGEDSKGLQDEGAGRGQTELDGRPAHLPPQPGTTADVVSLAYQQGRVVEVVCPDCAAHGVGVALHLFRPQQQL